MKCGSVFAIWPVYCVVCVGIIMYFKLLFVWSLQVIFHSIRRFSLEHLVVGSVYVCVCVCGGVKQLLE